MSETAGFKGKLKQASSLGSSGAEAGYTAIDGVTDVSGPLARAMLDISNLKDDDGFKRFIYGMAERKLSVKGKRIVGDTQQDALRDANEDGTVTYVAFEPDGTAASGRKFEVLVTSFDETAGMGGTVDFSAELQMNGAPLPTA
jgi:predicted secreted protein